MLDLRQYTCLGAALRDALDRKSTRLNSSHANNSYAVFCLKKKHGYVETARPRGVAGESSDRVAVAHEPRSQRRSHVPGHARQQDVQAHGAGPTKLRSTSAAPGAPARASATSNSASKMSSTRWAPSPPAAAKPQRTGRPTITARAPSASALIFFLPRRIPPYLHSFPTRRSSD